MSSIPTKRSRASQEQLSQMVDFMYDNPGFTGVKSLKFYGKIERDRIWSELADVLNSLGTAVKTVDQWQGVWKDLKCRTSLKVRARKGQKRASYQDPITDLEKRVIAVIGRDYIESHDSEKEIEYEEEPSVEMPSTSAKTPETYEPPQIGVKRSRVENNDFRHEKSYLELIGKQADALKILAQSNAVSAEVFKKQAETFKMLAESSAEGITALANALNNFTNAINNIANSPSFLEKLKKCKSKFDDNNVKSNTSQRESLNNPNNLLTEDDLLQDSNSELPITLKFERDD